MYYKLRFRGLYIGGSWDFYRMLDFGLDFVVYVLGWWYILCKLIDYCMMLLGIIWVFFVGVGFMLVIFLLCILFVY